ncbi:MAG: hypothetical protein AAF483_17290 [Planctomycetota bacterium]
MQRVLELRDSIAKKNEQTLESQLDAIIKEERKHLGELQQLAASIQSSQTDMTPFREAVRKLGDTQRRIISNLQQLQLTSNAELQKLNDEIEQGNPANSATGNNPASGAGGQGVQQVDPRVRAAQIKMVLTYIDRAAQKLARARSYTRRSQANRAFVRWSSGLTETKRARDQLRLPVEILSILISDSSLVQRQVETLVDFEEKKAELDVAQLPPGAMKVLQPPVWLTTDLLKEQVGAQEERTEELSAIFSSIGQSVQDSQELTAEQQRELEAYRLALPFLKKAVGHFARADLRLKESQAAPGADIAQIRIADSELQSAIEQLSLAAEYFYDVRRLIELMYGQESRIQNLLQQTNLEEANAEEYSKQVYSLQQQNAERLPRLRALIDEELTATTEAAQANSPTGGNNQPGSNQTNPNDAQEADPERRRVELAIKFVEALDQTFEVISGELQSLQSDPPTLPDERPPSPATTLRPNQARLLAYQFAAPKDEVDLAVEILEELRRLYFSLIEHLRDTARRQAELNDATNSAFPESSPTHNQFASYAPRQEELKEIASELSKAFADQAEQMRQASQQPQQSPADSGGPDPEELTANADRVEQAVELIAEGADLMQTAVQALESISSKASQEPKDDLEAKALDAEQEPMKSQGDALLKLLEALQLLDQQQNQDNQDQQDQQDSQEQQQDQQNESSSSPSRPRNQQQLNSEQMLQAIRDQEAKRRKEKGRPAVVGDGTVEKDW